MQIAINPDEMSQVDPLPGIELAAELGVGLEIRTVFGKNVLQLSDRELQVLTSTINARGVAVAAIASPLFKWGHSRMVATSAAGAVDSFRFPLEVSSQESEEAVDRAAYVCEILDAPIVRVFSYLRDDMVSVENALMDIHWQEAVDTLVDRGIEVALENEPVCTVATAAELEQALRLHDRLDLWFDPANLATIDEDAGLEKFQYFAKRARYVHAKDIDSTGNYCLLGEGIVQWPAILESLRNNDNCTLATETHVGELAEDAIRHAVTFVRGALA